MNELLLATSTMTAAQAALLAALCVGVSCGLLGSYVVVRRVALVGDALSHAVFPGVVAGFMWSEEKNLYLIFGCALVAGLLGVMMVRAIVQTTRVKDDAALGIVLASFFGIGLLWNSTKQQSGVKSFLFGNLSTIDSTDLWLMFAAAVLVTVAILLLLRPFQVLSFDEGFAVGLGYPVKILNFIFFGLLTFSVVVALQAVGVVLVSAMLITPAATAYLLTDRLERMMIYSVIFGCIACTVGWYVSSQRSGLAPGPVISLTGAFVFGLVYFFAPKHGILSKLIRHLRGRQRVLRENILKAIYKQLEVEGFSDSGISIAVLAEVRRCPLEDAMKQAKLLVKSGEATYEEGKSAIYLTPTGWRRAAEIVRNHRLWELYLTNLADYEEDHVHDDAEVIEHLLGAETVRKLERELDFPQLDPHGKPIPVVTRDVQLEGSRTTKQETGYGG
ncbi:manganese/zinc/iron transport system permease protein [Rubritalea squalenifaciens DSM 18772]|uniref:Manganese/zinc/iron transport system permease protein n=1 Tax=Rubritalea squalenifaciens DSM 18772 TaxID=1123071 RepID=A0A1M6IQT4_9BACT|nr:iron chelate uptake ABC transporter family permease subunit [Rubritalea squalenifaciens]SHJ36767.1 manganese/zinc/iron transport system permease protein [Rubritalea squalenifaciens DSM 18772]